MKQVLKLASLSGVALGILSSIAVAADLPSRKAPVPYIAPPPVFTWTGIYVGINAGAAFRTSNNNNSGYYGYGYPYYGYGYGFGNNNNNSRVAFIGGGQVGYNWQFGQVVLGFEVDNQYRSSFNSNNNSVFGSNSNRGNFLGTARGRLGYSITPMFMIYATGGLAYGTTDVTDSGFQIPTYGVQGGGLRSFRVGYTIGGGLEYAFTPNWSVKAEYLYVDLRKDNNNNLFNNNNSQRNQFHVGRVGLNYRFNMFGGSAPVVAAY